MNEYHVGYVPKTNIRSAALYEWRKLPPNTNASCGVYYTDFSREKNRDSFATHNCMNPSSGDDHCITLRQINPGDFVNHVTKPCMILYLASGPAFVGSKICSSGAYEEEGL